MKCFGIRNYRRGDENQANTLGLSLTDDKNFKHREFLLETSTGKPLVFSEFENYQSFKKEIFRTLEAAKIKEEDIIPDTFILPSDQGNQEVAIKNVDMMCKAVRDYYQENEALKKKVPHLKTIVFNSFSASYENVDYACVSRHSIDETLPLKEGSQTYIPVEGIMSPFNKIVISQSYESMRKKPDFRREMALKNQKAPNAVFCLGGRVDNPTTMPFDLDVAQDILSKAKTFTQKGYNVFIVNGPRTPADVSDYLYEEASKIDGMRFYNSKSIGEENDENFRNYPANGVHAKEFKDQTENLGGIYRALLYPENTVVVHTYDSFAGCETSQANIPTLIYKGKFKIDKEVRPDCYKLYDILTENKYASDVDTFLAQDKEPKDYEFTPLPPVAEKIASEIKKYDSQKRALFMSKMTEKDRG
ncbi:MAG: hypothetical protein EOM53_02620 [Alphaproteobacteria bacterium]|nr:hypothetical protein [Alphaproteobacteria bacterium]